MNPNETNPYTGKPLNPQIEIIKNGELTRVEYTEDYLIKTDLYDNSKQHLVWRLNSKLTREEWMAVRKYFKKYNHERFCWGTTNTQMVVLTLAKMRKPHIDRFVIRKKMTISMLKKLKELNSNMFDGVTGEYLIPIE